MTSLRRNAIANTLGRAGTALLWVAVTPFVLTRLGPERFGIWSLFFAFSAYLLALDLGLGSTMMRFIAAERVSGDPGGVTRTIRRGLGMALLLGLLWALFVAFARGWVVEVFRVPDAMVAETLSALLIFAIAVLIMFPAQVLMASLQGFERLDLSNLCLVLGVGAQVLALGFGLASGGGLEAAALAGVIGHATSGILAGVLLSRRVREIPPGGPGPTATWSRLLHFGAALQFVGLLVVLQFQTGKIVLGLLGDLGKVADYELAFRIAYAAVSMPALILGAVIPAASRIWESHGRAAVAALFTATSRWLYAYTVIALGLLWLVAPDLVRVWLGPGHDHIGGLIRIWTVAHAVNISFSPGAAIARGIGMPWIEVWSLATSVLGNLILVSWWAPRFGTEGAIAAVGVSFLGGFLVFSANFHRRSGIPFGPWVLRELIPRAMAGVLLTWLCAWLLSLDPIAAGLPPRGWGHGAVSTATFLALFALFFLPFGDTQRLGRALWQVAARVTSRKQDTPAT